jgi:uncharacterized repeat protein (TIGR02543 family)
MKVFKLALGLCMALLVWSCSGDDDAQIETFTVTFNSNGGTAVAPVEVSSGDTLDAPSPPTKDEYIFGGWYTDNGTFQNDFDFSVTPIMANTTLYAKWNVVTYTVSFESNGGSAVTAQGVSSGDTLDAPADPTKADYAFGGWYTDNDTFANAFDFTNTPITAEITLYAKWDDLLVVTFESNGGTAVEPVKVAPNQLLTKPEDPTKAGYRFVDWYTEDTFQSTFDFANTPVTEDMTLYAQWELVYTVSFDTNGGNDVSPLIVTSGQTISAPTDPVKDGFVFKGWYTDNGTFENAFDFDSTVITADITLYAYWYHLPATKGALQSLINSGTQLNEIDTSLITDMSLLFSGADSFNGSMADWDVSNVTDMQYMFHNAFTFDQDLSQWDVSKVTNMRGMFQSALAFNADISGWQVNEVTNMSDMFHEAALFNQDLGSWNVSKVTDMHSMFEKAYKFDQNIAAWQVAQVSDMQRMFASADDFNQDISGWAVTTDTNVVEMLKDSGMPTDFTFDSYPDAELFGN